MNLAAQSITAATNFSFEIRTEHDRRTWSQTDFEVDI